MIVTFTVPGAPQGKGRQRSVPLMRNGKPVIGAGGRPVVTNFTPEKTVAYESLVAQMAHQAMGGRPLLEGAVACHLFIDCMVPASWSQKKQRRALAGEIFPTVKPDTDNVIKAVYDGVNGIVWRDDVQVVDGRQRKRYAATPGVRVEIWSMTEPLEEKAASPVQAALLPEEPPAPPVETERDRIEREIDEVFR